jgi:DNA invertase Pin-like site-specific DNA recombinase
MKIGYARVSTDDQYTQNQIEELQKAGCDRIFEETASGGKWDRPQLHKALEQLREGDVFVVWKLDRLSRSLTDLIWCLDHIKKTGAGFRSLTEAIDTTTAGGELIMHVLGAFAQFERSIIRERTRLGLARARAAGRKGGGTFILAAKRQTELTKRIIAGEINQTEAANEERVSKATISRMVAREKTKLFNGKALDGA